MAGNILGTLLLNIVAQANTGGLDKTDRALKKTTKTINVMSKNMSFLANLSKGFLGYFTFRHIANAFQGYLQLEKDIGAMKSRFFAITQDERKAGEEFEWVRKMATETALDIKSTADSYSIFYSSVQKAMGTKGARQIYEDWTRVGRVLHLNEYQMERVTYALREMASKGAIYSQDLRMQIGTHVPNAMGLAQKASEEMGITGADWFEKLQKMAKGNSKVTSEFIQRFSKQARLMYGSESAFRKAMQQPDALMQKIRNIGYNFMVDFSKAGGSRVTVNILKRLVSELDQINLSETASTLSKIFKVLGDILSFLMRSLSSIVYLLKIMAFGYVGSKIGAGFNNVVGNIRNTRQLSRGVIAGTTSKFALRNLLRGSGGFLTNLIALATLRGGKKLLGTFLSRALGFIGGPWGLVFSLLPLIFDAVKGVWRAIDKHFGFSNKNWLSNPFGTNSTLTAGQVGSIATQLQKDIKSGKIKNQTDWQNKVAGYQGGSIYQYLNYNDQGQVTIYDMSSGGQVTAEEWDKRVKNKQQKVTQAGIKAFNSRKLTKAEIEHGFQ